MSDLTVCLLSGGLDSTVLLAHCLTQADVIALSVNYGQRHRKELAHAALVASHFNVEHRIAELANLRPLLAGSSQTSSEVEVPEGHYAEESMKLTVVPNRNMLLLAIAGAWAISRRADNIAYAAHSGDHPIYPDCRPEFATALGVALELADWHKVRLDQPFALFSKASIVKLGLKLDVPFHLTWSCYKGGEVHCGKCGTCVERREAFQLAEVHDPTRYE